MEKNKLDNLLQELYLFEPQLVKFEAQLIEIINQMLELRPDTKFDSLLAAKIKARLMEKIEESKKRELNHRFFKLNFINMNKSIYIYAGLATVFVLAFSFLSFNLINKFEHENKLGKLNEISSNSYEDWQERNNDDFVRVEPNAFGSLATISLTDLNENNNQNELDIKMAPAGAGGSSTMMLGAPDNARMIMPWIDHYEYIYQGDSLILDKSEGDVYRRLAITNNDGQRLANLISGLNLNGLDLSNFRNLKVQSISLLEDTDKGLAVNLDFESGSVSIYENWSKWRFPEREACGDDNACWQSFRLNIEDIPTDSVLINKANNFIKNYNIDLSNYGEPVVDNNWRFDYERSNDKVNFYIPETVSVVYPLLADDITVRDQSGNYSGVRVNINMFHQAVSGLNNFSINHYELSSYALETDFQRIVKIAEHGGWRLWFNVDIENTKEQKIVLDTPEFTYINLWKYSNNKNEELLVPALIFPVVLDNVSEYYGRQSIVVPLVKEMLDELELNQVNNKRPGEMAPIPMTR